jgi:hypothetical protein
MTGLFNTSGHETERQTEVAASRLFEGLGVVNQMLSKVELSDVKEANVERQKAIELLQTVAPEFEALASSANDTPLFWSRPSTTFRRSCPSCPNCESSSTVMESVYCYETGTCFRSPPVRYAYSSMYSNMCHSLGGTPIGMQYAT